MEQACLSCQTQIWVSPLSAKETPSACQVLFPGTQHQQEVKAASCEMVMKAPLAMQEQEEVEEAAPSEVVMKTPSAMQKQEEVEKAAPSEMVMRAPSATWKQEEVCCHLECLVVAQVVLQLSHLEAAWDVQLVCPCLWTEFGDAVWFLQSLSSIFCWDHLALVHQNGL
jgi:hypothetical protein